MTDFSTLLYTSTGEIPTLSYTWSLKKEKRYPFLAEPPSLGHYTRSSLQGMLIYIYPYRFFSLTSDPFQRTRCLQLLWPHAASNMNLQVYCVKLYGFWCFWDCLHQSVLMFQFFLKMRESRTGCGNVSYCQRQQSYSGLRSPGRSNSTYLWNDSWVQTFHN